MLISAWDVVKRVPITWELTSLKVGERSGLLRMLLRLPPQAVLVLDRGYPGRDVLGEIVGRGRDFVVRMVSAEAGSWKAVAEFIASAPQGNIAEWFITKANEALRRIERWKQKTRPGRSASRKPMHPYARKITKSSSLNAMPLLPGLATAALFPATFQNCSLGVMFTHTSTRPQTPSRCWPWPRPLARHFSQAAAQAA